MNNVIWGPSVLMVVICLASSLHAEEAVTENTGLLDAITTGTLNVDVRLRYEHASQDGLKASDAITVRPRFGYGTKPYLGVSAYLEFEDVEALNDGDDYNQAGTNPEGAGRTSIADVEGAEVNQAYVAAVCPMTNLTAKLGRQRIQWDNERFIGNVGWRQNEQTFDAVTLGGHHADLFELAYGYVDNVNRIFGDANGTRPAGEKPNTSDFNSDSHLIHVTTRALPFVTVSGYAYLLDLGTRDFAASNSSDTVGLRLTGTQVLREGYALDYEGEYARQTDNTATADGMDYAADYYLLKLGCSMPLATVGLAHEVLSGDNGVGFATPLATGHAFNGWADVFLATPAAGLEDNYAFVSANLPGKIAAKVMYHAFSADQGSMDFGSEVDVDLKRKFGKTFSLQAQYANYMADSNAGNPRAADVEKFTLDATLTF